MALTLAVAAAVTLVLTDDDGRATASRSAAVAPPLTWRAGACVRREEQAVALTRCSAASGRVLAIGAARRGVEPPCPVDTDEFTAISGGRVACVRELAGPHPGDPGQGGGLLRAGDCVTRAGEEWPCARPGWYGRVVARTTSVRSCPRVADHYLYPRVGAHLVPRPVTCLRAR